MRLCSNFSNVQICWHPQKIKLFIIHWLNLSKYQALHCNSFIKWRTLNTTQVIRTNLWDDWFSKEWNISPLSSATEAKLVFMSDSSGESFISWSIRGTVKYGLMFKFVHEKVNQLLKKQMVYVTPEAWKRNGTKLYSISNFLYFKYTAEIKEIYANPN